MKIKIEIDTTEQFSNRRNILSLIDMVMEETEGTHDNGQTEYKSDGGKLQTCSYSVAID